MTLTDLQALAVGTPVFWNRTGVNHRDTGVIAERHSHRFIQWDDGTTLGLETDAPRGLRWVKVAARVAAREGRK